MNQTDTSNPVNIPQVKIKDEVKWNCLDCGGENVSVLQHESTKGHRYSVTSVPLGVAEELHGAERHCAFCKEPHGFSSPRERITMSYCIIHPDDRAKGGE